MPGLDLRVHYGAASTSADDLRYQAQADSYIQATTSRTIDLCRPLVDEKVAEDPRPVRRRSQRLSEDTRAAVRQVNSQLLFVPKLVARTSTTGTLRTKPGLSDSASRSASKTSSSSRSIASSHLVTPALNNVATHRRRVPPSQSPTALHTRRIIARKSAAGDSRTTDEKELQNDAQSVSHGSQHLSVDRNTSQMPSSYSLSNVNILAESSASKSGHQTTTNEHSSRSREQEGGLCERTSSQPLDTATKGVHDASTSSRHPIRLIMPPVPAVSLRHFSTHITDKLQFLAADESLAKHYSPSSMKRAIEDSERGYWSLDVQTWSVHLQTSFWQFLEDFIGSGSAGFGVTCSLSQFTDGVRGSEVKVFCWGEIVSHTYLLLYVASQGKLRSTLASWTAASGDVIMQVCPRKDMSNSRKKKRRSK